MREADKRDPKEELLAEALDACMEEQLSFIPPECEIARMHTFSQQFREYMEQLLKTKGRPQRRSMNRKEFIYSFNRAAACILVLLTAAGIFAGGLLLVSKSGSKSSMDMSSPAAEAPAAAEEEAEAPASEETGGVYDFEAGEETEEPEAAAAGDSDKGAVPGTVEFMGGSGQHVNAHVLNINFDMSCRLYRVGVENHLPLPADLTDFLDRFNCTDFIVGKHNAYQCSIFPDRFCYLLRCDHSLPGNIQKRDFKAFFCKLVQRVQYCVVFDFCGYQMALAFFGT